MARTFTFSFDELPLTILNGFEAGCVSGSADISYTVESGTRDFEWGIEAISLDGWRAHTIAEHDLARDRGQKLPIHARRSVQLDEGSPLYLMIYDRLESEWRDKVVEAVQQDIAEHRAEATHYNSRMGRLAGVA